MNGHFSVINKRGTLTACIMMAFSIILFSVSLAKKFNEGSIIWNIPLTICIIIFLLTLMILISVVTAGIDVRDSEVIFANASGMGGKQPQCKLSEIKDIQLHNADGIIENPEGASLVGGRIVFLLKDGSQKVYYPVALTAHQFNKVKTGLLNMQQEEKENKQKKNLRKRR